LNWTRLVAQSNRYNVEVNKEHGERGEGGEGGEGEGEEVIGGEENFKSPEYSNQD